MARERVDQPISSLGYRKVARGLALLLAVLMLGTLGYMLIEGWSFLDSMYMTVITITTVGYREVGSVDEPGKFFTMVVIFMGMGIMAYTVGMVAQAMVEFQLKAILGRRKLGMKIKSIRNHYIICGYGRIGRIITNELKAHKIPFLVLDSRLEMKETLDHDETPYLIGDATNEEVLTEAGIGKAKGLVSVVTSDADNLFITLTARVLNPNLFILARADEDHTQRKLLRAGANRVVQPYLIGGQRMAQTIIRPAVTDFLELSVQDKDIKLKMEEMAVGETSRLKDVTLVDSGIRQEMNVIIVAIREKGGEMVFNPSSHTRIQAGDTLIALGDLENLTKLAGILAGGA